MQNVEGVVKIEHFQTNNSQKIQTNFPEKTKENLEDDHEISKIYEDDEISRTFSRNPFQNEFWRNFVDQKLRK